MSGQKLYHVGVTVNFTVLASDKEDAVQVALLHFEEATDFSEVTSTTEIQNEAQLLPVLKQSTPFYEEESELTDLDLTCGEILKRWKEQDEDRRAKACPDPRQLNLFPED